MLSQSARIARRHFSKKGDVRNFVAACGMVKIESLQASMDLLLVLALNSFGSLYCAS